MPEMVWTKTYRTELIEDRPFSEDLGACGSWFSGVSHPLVMHVVDVKEGDRALYKISSLTDNAYKIAPFRQSDLRNRVPREVLPDMDSRITLFNPYGVAVLVSGVSKGYVTVVRQDDDICVMCHDSANTAAHFLSYVAARHRVEFHDYEMTAFFNELDVPDAD